MKKLNQADWFMIIVFLILVGFIMQLFFVMFEGNTEHTIDEIQYINL